MPLSTTPLQSLSLPSQSSCVGTVSPTQVSTPALHAVRPCLHSPTLLPHTLPTPARLPSSGMPLQSLSTPSHVSGLGSFGPVQIQPATPEHTRVPLLHGWVSVPLSLQLPPGG